MNLDGSGLKKIIADALDNAQRITVYKGKLYGNTYGAGGVDTSIVSYNLDGTGRKVLYTGDLSVIPKFVGYGHRAYHIFNDRIYYMTRDRDVWWPSEKSIYSMKLDGSDQKLVTALDNSPWSIINVYDGYTGRYQFPNAKQDPGRTTVIYRSNLMVLNGKYTFAQNVLYNNDSAVPGHVRFSADYQDPNDDDIRGQRGWFPTTVPRVNTLTDIISFGSTATAAKLSDGWYNLRCMYNYLYLDEKGGAQLRTTDTKQKFQFENKNGNYYTIKTEDGKYLGIADTVVNGVQVRAVDDEYLWALRSENNNDIFSMRPANNGEMILNAAGQKNTDGTWIILWKYDKEDAPNHAEFRFIPVE